MSLLLARINSWLALAIPVHSRMVHSHDFPRQPAFLLPATFCIIMNCRRWHLSYLSTWARHSTFPYLLVCKSFNFCPQVELFHWWLSEFNDFFGIPIARGITIRKWNVVHLNIDAMKQLWENVHIVQGNSHPYIHTHETAVLLSFSYPFNLPNQLSTYVCKTILKCLLFFTMYAYYFFL